MNPTIAISERLLQFIWQFQKFNNENLVTENDHEPIQVIQIGNFNTNAGPDFLEAKLQIGSMLWAGNIEIHIKASDWNVHKHAENMAYDSVILHIVWENDLDIFRKNGQKIPVLSLKNRIEPKLLTTYTHLIENFEPIPCYSQFKNVNNFLKTNMLERTLVARLERKAALILEKLEKNQGDWEQTTYEILAKTMGFGLNSIPFERLASIVPLKIIQKHADQILSVEALLFGAAGFLEQPLDEYSATLQKEYQFLKAKYGLDYQLNKHEWKFMRLRPANFPTVRLAQFAQMVQKTKSLFSYFLLSESPQSLKNMLKTKPTSYWETRFNFGEKSSETQKGMGQASIDILLINTVAQILAAYSISKIETSYIEKAMELLENIKAENNKITRLWASLGFPPQNAFDSQAQIELYREYCQKKACLSCIIGANILK